MKRLAIHVEGKTESFFVRDILRPYLAQSGVDAYGRQLITNRKGNYRGGIPRYLDIRNDLIKDIKHDPSAEHAIMLDLYGLPGDFPDYHKGTHAALNPFAKADILKAALASDLALDGIVLKENLINIQPYEFEGLLFSDPQKLAERLKILNRGVKAEYFEEILEQFPSPEHINNHPNSAPSKRIMEIARRYEKVIDGNAIFEMIGIETVRQKCRRFDEWLASLAGIG